MMSTLPMDIKPMDPAQALEQSEIAKNLVINETIIRGETPVQRFYAGTVVLVTGGSGFLGKQLIEKLIRSCKIQKIYILLRPKKQTTVQERIKNILQDELYNYLRKKQPHFVNKLIPVSGDITELGLGLTDETWTTLTEEVNVIFHEAATVNFLEPLKIAILTNVRGTREIVKLAKNCKHLKALVHISTAFCHATTEHLMQPVLEEFYPSPFSPKLLIELAEELDDTKLNAITPEMLEGWPNSYSFTKAVAEELVRTMAEDLPVCVVRPAVVMPAYREPPGWVDKSSMNGAVGFIIGACLGGLHVMLANGEKYSDMVPVDVVNNATIVAACEAGTRRARGETGARIYTVTRSRNPSKIKKFHEFLDTTARRLHTPRLLWHGYVIRTTNNVVFNLLYWLLQYIPGYLADGVLTLMGSKPKVVKLFDRAYKQNKIYAFYTTNDWHFEDSNLLDMYRNLSPEDRIIYNCNAALIESIPYFMNCLIGARKYILKDGLQNTEYAVKKAFWLRILNYIVITLYVYVLWKLAYILFIYLFSCMF